MKYALAALIIFTAFPAIACEGYNNAMGALEAAIAQKSQLPQSQKSVPPITEINKAIDDLEAAMEKHRREKHQTPAHATQSVTQRNTL